MVPPLSVGVNAEQERGQHNRDRGPKDPQERQEGWKRGEAVEEGGGRASEAFCINLFGMVMLF